MITDRRAVRAPFLHPDQATSGDAGALIRRLEQFDALEGEARNALERIAGTASSVAARTDLIREGEAPEGIFILLDGMACRSKLRRGGPRQITAYLIPGDFCDLDLALRPRMDHTVSTISTCRVAHLDFASIQQLAVEAGNLVQTMRRATLVDDAILREWLLNVGARSAIQRIAHLFCELLTRFRAVGLAQGDSYELPISQLDLADTTGLSTVHVNRTLQDLRRQGLIEFRSRSLMIRNLPRLQALGEFDPSYLARWGPPSPPD
jgi:CRP-like cAMP-binding protein